ncbi:Hydroxylamine reductase [Limihaloglobus sulfuriphilus]|uniref:Hydroxylamine reductase n=1 Tax=Limihaloglobus sulfuriphilus TaxID=1851148 RepID=A0A1Q2MFG8_9BACT|nr:hydroxylamine reductase [Limihaloglobus sulfuriphilus]AQQ71455.1 Hydroxylamine reductase [Limihaloglobus sulfuriphilus]
MFCYQCEQTAGGHGCTKMGVCGKQPETSDLQDLLIYLSKAISMYAWRAAELGFRKEEIDRYVVEALFTTVTNVNFDSERIVNFIKKGYNILAEARALYEKAASDQGRQPHKIEVIDSWNPPQTYEEMLAESQGIGIAARLSQLGDDVTGLQELITYGLKGMAAYADHAAILGISDPEVYKFIHEALNFLTADEGRDADALTAMALKVGEVNLRVMEMLDEANTGTYGHPEPTVVRVTPKKGKAILVSGHDLKDLAILLEQTKDKGINIYTHGEMLPCLAYPELKKYPHLAGNYGGAWQDQKKEFDEFPGAILMTTNCIQKPAETYKARIFTTGLVAWPGVTHIADKDFTPVIEAALAEEGFTEDAPEKTITIGFGRNAVMSVAPTVIDAVKAGKIRHFFLVGGCDGAKSGRNYYTEFAQKVPDDCVILTLACGKYRFNKLEFGDIGGIPRLLDIGQCNDAYSAIKIAGALAEAFDCGVNDLPLSIILSWYEQKAVCILLTLLHLGIKNMKLGPTLPAFVSPAVLNVLVENFNIAPIKTADEDLAEILG